MSCSALSDSICFFTVRAAHRGTDVFLREIDLLRAAIRETKARHPFEICEIVVLGDVIHALWRLPADDTDFALRWRMVRTLLARRVAGAAGAETARPGRLWQRRYWEHPIRDANDLAAHRHMIWTAPVQAGLVTRPEDWLHSSIHRAKAEGVYDATAPVRPAYLPALAGVTRAPYRLSGARA
ncbi:MAG: transposase [Pseudomonadota bacterium]